jgi:hypothetical protein
MRSRQKPGARSLDSCCEVIICGEYGVRISSDTEKHRSSTCADRRK